jgi:agmatine/peptidylarginine deiminase
MFFERFRPGWAAVLALVGSIHCGAASTGSRLSANGPGERAATSEAVESPALEPRVAPEWPADDSLASLSEPGFQRRLQVTTHWLSSGRGFTDTLRGDWDTPSALMVVYNSTWKRALGRLLSIAHTDLPVYVLATPKDARSREFTRWLRRVPFAGLVSIELDTPWIRDYGPLEVVRPRGISWLDLTYAPDDRPLDDAVPSLLGEVFEASNEREHLPLDGGGIISSGAGLCGITEASFRPLGVDTSDPGQVERFLETVGCRTLALLPELPSESTGHVDMVAQFLAPDKVAIAVPTRKSPREVRVALQQARRALELAAAAHGQPLSFVELPIESRRSKYYSYVNGLRTPSHYFVPSYSNVSRKLEREVRRRLSEALDGVEVVSVDSDEMIESGGAIHCVTLGLKHHLVPRLLEERSPALTWRAPGTRLALSPVAARADALRQR